MGEGFVLTDAHLKKIAHNANLALALLRKYNLTNSADALQSYIDDIGILA